MVSGLFPVVGTGKNQSVFVESLWPHYCITFGNKWEFPSSPSLATLARSYVSCISYCYMVLFVSARQLTMTATIKTNNQPRELMYLSDFSLDRQQQIRSEFDWVKDIDSTQGFFEYRSTVYHLRSFLRVDAGTDDLTQGWDGYEADTYFSGTLVRLCSDPDFVIVGSYCS